MARAGGGAVGALRRWVRGASLAEQGYRSGNNHLYVMAQLSSFLLDGDLDVGELSDVLGEFSVWRRCRGYVGEVSSKRMSQLLDYLVAIGVVSATESPRLGTPAEQLVERYRRYLVTERGLAVPSVRAYVEVAATFLSSLSPEGDLYLESLSTAEVTRFVLAECRRLKVGSAKATTTRLRSLLRFFCVEGLIPCVLADVVPSVASWRLGSLPRGSSPSRGHPPAQELRPATTRRSARLRRAHHALTPGVARRRSCGP